MRTRFVRASQCIDTSSMNSRIERHSRRESAAAIAGDRGHFCEDLLTVPCARLAALGESCYRPAVGSKAPSERLITAGSGFTMNEFICRSGPCDRPFEERHDRFTISAVVGGSFVYKTDGGKVLLYP